MGDKASYRGRIAPTPTGYMHLGHARTFLEAQRRSEEMNGQLFMRIEDLDRDRCKGLFVDALEEDLSWVGLSWDPEIVVQSERLPLYVSVWNRLRAAGWIYPCRCSRRDVARATVAPNEGDGESLYPGKCRNLGIELEGERAALGVNWRFRVPDGEAVRFVDRKMGAQSFVAGSDFGDFIVWRKDGFPAYELAVVADDVEMGITEVVRGEDLLASTARQLLLYEALGKRPPAFFHCPLVRDRQGRRLAKRDKALGLRELRTQGVDPEQLEELW